MKPLGELDPIGGFCNKSCTRSYICISSKRMDMRLWLPLCSVNLQKEESWVALTSG